MQNKKKKDKRSADLKGSTYRKFFKIGRLLSLREANWSSPDTNVRTVDTGGDALLVQLLAGPGCNSWSSGSSGHEHAYSGDDVHGS